MQDTEHKERAFWTLKIEEAREFMEKMRAYPIVECGEPMASLQDAVDGLEVQFSTRLINNRYQRVFFCRERLISKFRAVAREMNDRGWILKVEDAYRSPEMQRAQGQNPRHFDLILQKSIWELGGVVPEPAFLMGRMSAIIAARCRIGTHVSGSAIDISVFDRETGQELPRGGQYVEISHRTPMDSPFITPEERENRCQITEIFRRHGWWEYPWEFWHYSSGDSYQESLSGSTQPARYGPVFFDGKSITPIEDSLSDELLNPEEFYETQIRASLQRLNEASAPVRP